MPHKPGDQLGPYEIVALAGAGGMGEVYKARDRRLDRTVALKVLPAHLASAISRERFEREARLISTLTHPNVCTLHDIGEADGVMYLVMEFVEGESLAQRLVRGPLPLQQVIRFGAEMCNALEAAHRRGIVHRDLKPGNIMITRSGVKLLDFGLAKLAATETVSEETARLPITEEGAVVGTLQYLSPEQLDQKPADARSDIFAAGAVLYEMATGRRAFEGPSRTSIITAILHSDPPPIATLQPMASSALERIIRPCLAKDPEHRWQTAHDVALQLQSLAGGTSATDVAPPPARSSKRFLVPLASALAGLALGAAIVTGMRSEKPKKRVQLVVPMPAGQSLFIENASADFAVAPDASKIVFATGSTSGPRLWVRSLSSGDSVPLRGTEGGVSPFFSPDGKSVAFFANGRLKTLAFDGGVSDIMASSGPGRGGVFLPDGSIVLSAIPGGPLERVGPDRSRKSITTIADGEGGHNWPAVLPGGKHLLFTCEVDGRSFDDARVEALDLATGKRKVILEGGTAARFLPPDRLFYAKNDRLLEVRFDSKTLAVSGEPRTVAAPLLVIPGSGAALYDVADDGTIVFVSRVAKTLYDRRLVWVDRSGRTTPMGLPPRIYFDPRISPNGRKLLVEVGGANDDLWVSDLSRGTFSRITFKAENLVPEWMPDSSSVVFSRYTSGLPDLYLTRADGSGVLEKFAGSGNALFPNAVTPSGEVLAVEFTAASAADLVLASRDGKIRRVISTPFNEWMADVSPDGKWIVYSSEESGRDEVYVQSISGQGEKTQLSSNGGSQPLWSRAGGEIFYRSGDQMMVVAVSSAGPFTASAPRLLFRVAAETGANTRFERNYDATPDGQRFVFVERVHADSTVTRLDVILTR